MPNGTVEAPPKEIVKPARSKRPADGRPAEVRSKAEVARLSPQQIYKMGREEMVQAIRVAQLPQVDRQTSQRLMYCDRATLERMVYLARRSCRNQGF